MRRRLAFAAVLALLPLSACSAPPFTTASTCIDWVFFETPDDAVAEADAVAVGRIVDQAGSTTYMGMPATTWNVEVDEWLEGSGDDEIVVTSLPRSCGDDGDSMASYQGTEPLVFFLRDDAEGWQLVTPWQGVVPAGPDGLPADWPDDIYG
ncbi:hypothetical protein [Streptomyces sp. AC495_CC817]|uniref:hypothetical protein n=1 Tax=Streptomyces sp. AC495_CC817 TaxID=2823900 RepID=UPI001C26FC4E|nr:hypothetical protein [Streptomyces sp. AC495_CC817]